MIKFKVFNWDIINGIKNFIKFRKVIWNYRDWDYSYLLSVNIALFESMAKFFHSSDISEGDKDIAKELDEVAKLLKLLNYSDFFDYDYLYKYTEKGFSEKELLTPEPESEYNKDVERLFRESELIHRAVKRRLFRLLNRYSTWWN